MTTIAVYALQELGSGKFYIGSTSNLTRRLREHKRELKANCHYNKNLQALYNSGSVFRTHYLETDTIERARLIEKSLLTKAVNDPKLLNYSTAGFGNGIPRHPNKKQIIEKISKSRKKSWEELSVEEKDRRIETFKHCTTTPECLVKRSNSYKKYWNSLPLEKRKLSNETKEKIGKSNTGKNLTQETKEKIRLANIGKKHSMASRLKMSASRKRYYDTHGVNVVTEETKEKIRQKNIGKTHTEETKKKLSELAKKRLAAIPVEKRKHSAEVRKRISDKHKGKTLSPEHRLKLSESKKRFFSRTADREATRENDLFNGIKEN